MRIIKIGVWNDNNNLAETETVAIKPKSISTESSSNTNRIKHFVLEICEHKRCDWLKWYKNDSAVGNTLNH